MNVQVRGDYVAHRPSLEASRLVEHPVESLVWGREWEVRGVELVSPQTAARRADN
jgi:hypothetical protein